MNNHLEEFELLTKENSKKSNAILILLFLQAANMYFNEYYYKLFQFSKSDFKDPSILLFFILNLLPVFSLFLFFKEYRAGWFLAALQSIFIFSMLIKVVYLFLIGSRIFSVSIVVFTVFHFFVNSLVTIILLYSKDIKRKFNSNISLQTIPVIIGILTLCIGLFVIS